MRLLVTGGAGFIGSHCVRTLVGGDLAAPPDAVVVLDALTDAGNRANLEPVAADPRLEFVHGDITDELGYAPRVPFDRGLAETVAWSRDNRSWWEPLKARAALAG